jgi:integrase
MEKQISFMQEFHKFIDDSFKGKRRNGNGKKIKAGTIEQYHTVGKYLARYENEHRCTLRILVSNSLSQKFYCKERAYWIKFKRKFELFLRNRFKCFDVFIAAVFKIIRTFFNYLRGEKGLRIALFNKVFNSPSYSYTPVIVDITRLKYLIGNESLRHELTATQIKCLDIFITGCSVGLRFSDLINLKHTDIRQAGRNDYLELTTKKTDSTVIIPLPVAIVEIIHQQKKQKNNFIFSKISNTNFNLHIKTIMKKAGFTELRPKYRHKNGKLIEVRTKYGESYRFYDHISSHSMRRIAITSLLTLGVPEQIVRRLSGHAPGSKEFFRYVALAQDYSNTEIVKAQAKLFE